MLESYIKELSPKLEKSIEFLESELTGIHTGRASVSLVDDVVVNAYGSKQALKQVANITIPEARQIAIQPWDKALSTRLNPHFAILSLVLIR